MTDVSPRELADRHVAVWTEPDAEPRREAIQELQAEDGAHILRPQQEIRQAAAGLGFTRHHAARLHHHTNASMIGRTL